MADIEYPRVSEVLDILDWEYKDIPKDVLKSLAEYGTGLHNVIGKSTTGQRTRVSPKYRARLFSLRKWLDEKGFEVIQSEVPVRYTYNYQGNCRGFTGTLDAIVRNPISASNEIWDWKTGKFNKRHVLQVNGYALAYEQINGYKDVQTRLVSPKKDGVLDFVCPNLRKEFLDLVNLYYYLKT